MIKTLLLAATIIAASSSQVLAGLITFSDNFESEPVPPDPPSYIPNYRDFQQWDVIGAGVDLVGPGGLFPPRIDSLMVDLDHTSGSTLITKEAFDLVPRVYKLSFDLGGPVGGTLFDTVRVDLGSVFSEEFTVQRGDPFVTFERKIMINHLVAGPAKLGFTDLGADSNGAFLDNVSFASVDNQPIHHNPEPSTLALSMIGLACLVGCRRIRSKMAASRSV